MLDKFFWWIGLLVCAFSALGFISFVANWALTKFLRTFDAWNEFFRFVAMRAREKRAGREG